MIAHNIAYVSRDGKHVTRVQCYRNRQERLFIRDVSIDAAGHIKHKPIGKLACFANPVEYLRGEFDTRATFKGEQGPPRGCAGCLSRPACGKFAHQRIQMDAGIAAQRSAWEAATQRLEGAARYEHATFTEFATACDERGWTSDNEDALSARRAEEAKRKRQARAKDKRKSKRGKTATPAALAALDDERDQRQEALVTAARAARAPSWLRKLPDRTIAFTCDVWQVNAAIERRHGGEVTGGDVTRAMVAVGRDYGMPGSSLRVRVNEALKRIGRLEHEPEEAPVWAAFEAAENQIPPRSPGQLLNGVVSVILEDN